MSGLFARLIGGAVAPIIERLSQFGATLAKKLALFFVAGVCFAIVLLALTIAFDLWIASLAGSIVGALAVAGVYLVIGTTSVLVALRSGAAPEAVAEERATEGDEAAAHSSRGAQIDHFTAPLLNILQNLGLRREQLAVLAGASVAKQLRPIPLVGLAIVAGFLFGRIWKGWGSLMSTDLVTTFLGLVNMLRQRVQAAQGESAAAPDQAL